MTLLLGRSASGKSTLLRLMAGTEHPTDGHVSINDCVMGANARVATLPGLSSWLDIGATPTLGNGEEGYRCGVRPVMLRGKPAFDDTLPVMERLVRVAIDAARSCNAASPRGEDAEPRLRALAGDFAGLLGLSPAQRAAPPSALSPSGEFLFGLAVGCLLSVAPVVRRASNEAEDEGVPYPVLLLDEVFDAEHPGTAKKCHRGIANLVHRGGVVVVATHRPEHFEGLRSRRTVTLSGGRVLKVETCSR